MRKFSNFNFAVYGFLLGCISSYFFSSGFLSGFLENSYQTQPQIGVNVEPKQTKPTTASKDMNHDHRLSKTSSLIETLKSGGYLLFIRHTHRDRLADSQSQKLLDNTVMVDPPVDTGSYRKAICLTDQGIAEAKAIGSAIKRLNIPLSRIYTSPTCRAKETAKNMFPWHSFTIEPALVPFYMQGSSPHREKIRTRLKELLSSTPPKGSNIALSSHGNTLDHIGISLEKFSMGATAIFDPSSGAPKHIGTLYMSDWMSVIPLQDVSKPWTN